MSITSACGHHCGIRSNAEGTVTREGHCDCAECHDGAAAGKAWASVISGTGMTRTDVPELSELQPRGTPMCERWYAQSAGVKPWEDPRVLREGVPAGSRPGAVAYPVIPTSHGAGL